MRLLQRLLRRAMAPLAVLATFALATPAAAEPQMWVIRDEDSTIYLMGTVHLLKPEVTWRSAKIDSALAESRELVLEAADLDDSAALAPFVRAHGLDLAKPLSSKLAEKDRPRLTATLSALGMQPAAVEPMQPWLAAVTLSVAPMIKAGYDPNSGVERLLMAEARAAGRPIAGLETAERQLRYLSELPQADQVGFLTSTLDDFERAAIELDAMVAAWAAGDSTRLEALFVSPLRSEHPTLYQALVVERNRAWAGVLEEKLKGSGVSFVAVGAGHVVGPDSVQVELARRGIRAEVH